MSNFHIKWAIDSGFFLYLRTTRTFQKQDMWTARQRLKSPQSLSGTSSHPTMVTLVNIMVMNGWLTYFSFHVYRPSHSWDKATSDFDLEISTPRSRSRVRSKVKVTYCTQHSTDTLPRAANLWNIISVFCWKNFRILSNFSVSLNLFLTRLKTFIRQLPIYSGGTHPLPVETLVDSFGTTGTGSEARKRVTTTCGREKIECFGD